MLALGGITRRVAGKGGEDRSPAWSPDGRWILFSRLSEALEHTRGDNWEFFLVRPDGSGQHRLTDNFLDDEQPAWSPDGSRIAISRDRDIWALGSDGGALRRLTRGPADDGEPAWSPDGRRLVFSSDRGGGGALWIVEADGSRLRRVPGTEGASGPSRR